MVIAVARYHISATLEFQNCVALLIRVGKIACLGTADRVFFRPRAESDFYAWLLRGARTAIIYTCSMFLMFVF